MDRKKIEIKKLLKLVGSADLVEIKKGVGGKVIKKTIIKVKKKTPSKSHHCEWDDYTEDGTYTEHQDNYDYTDT